MEKEIIKHIKQQMVKAAIVLTNQIKLNLNTTGIPVGSKGVYHNTNPSKPGEYPHKMLGDLQRSITWEVISDNEIRIGTNLDYGKFLEIGTSKMAARPYLRRTLYEQWQKLATIINQPYK